ncbi:Leu/Phe/Val dehydrogenase [Alicyclobacillus fastidiosus]|uniref:Glu/Leu/Phe/Val dehydrogenase n=1 Tax=Alicyclobacillus fastidiosus TaxID=392011 RepID=A0ABV5AG01_9BACL|nr:Glu/Leu/Phe/Val dehydrogenase [Alicyclobacillus fastidiosus]WEH11747.1 Glu/Leu/Phe/Val dehydrogenase [Alicyclobacillus fastidiosus]
MEIFSYLGKYDYEQLVFCNDEASGLKAIIAIHDTTLGPALGGCRMWTYVREDDAILDALRLARGMTYKAAVSGLNLGGGKTVIMGNPKTDKSEALFRSLGRYIQGLSGRYITAEDVGTNVHDMDLIHTETDYVTGISQAYGSSGNPSPVTAFGVFRGMQATAKAAFGTDDLAGKRVAIQGLGSVGMQLARQVKEVGGELIVSDINDDSVRLAVEQLGAKAVSVKDIFEVECDIFAPCALGAVINDETVNRLRCLAVAGSANNQLAEDKHGDILHERGIAYAPDYVINAGGLMNVADELEGYNAERARAKVDNIYNIIDNIFDMSRTQNIPSYLAADRLAEQRIAQMRNVRSNYLRDEKSLRR